MVESTPSVAPNAALSWRRALVDVLLVFLVFAVDGAWPVPDVNETHYLSKAKHYWEPQWAERDLFLSSADSHVVFFATLGGLTHVLPLPAAAWCGRLITWALLAFGWRRLSFALVPRFGWAALTGAAAVALTERFHMAGEWFVGGCEAKCIAYALVFSGLADVVSGRWNRGLLQLGGATAFHVLVGGWSIVAVAFAWVCNGRQRPQIAQWLPGLVGCMLLALPGLLPAAALSGDVDKTTSMIAHETHVYLRLSHHLDPRAFVPQYGGRQALLWACWAAACVATVADPRLRTLRGFVAGAGAIALIGLTITYSLPPQHPLAASLLRFYWFRLSDAAVAVGLSLELAKVATTAPRTGVRRGAFAALVAVSTLHLGAVVIERAMLPMARGENLAYPDNLPAWQDVCSWIKSNTPHDALFLTPRSFCTFKWYAERAEAVTWKDVPQDAASLVEWRRRLEALYANRTSWLNYVPADAIRDFALQYDVDYLVTYRAPPLEFPQVYANNTFVVYSLKADGPESNAQP